MKLKTGLLLGALALVVILGLVLYVNASAVSGAAFTTFNPWVDGYFKIVCKNSLINCNIYGAKPDVWLNGGPAANGLGPDGEYFFAVLEPGGQPNPNDQGGVKDKNLSDDYDYYTDRQFTIKDGEVFFYGGGHDLDSGNFLDPNRKYCTKPRGCTPDGEEPLIRLFPYSDTTNPGGVYILAICYIGPYGDQYPVEPRDCKYDAFKVKEGGKVNLYLWGVKFEDMYNDGVKDPTDPLLPGWTIHVFGTGYFGEQIDETILTDDSGFWSFQKDYNYTKFTDLVPAVLTVCEVVQDGWYQSFPDPSCYTLTIPVQSLGEVGDLDFGNYRPVSISAYKYFDRDLDGEWDAGEGFVEGFEFCLYDAGGSLVAADDFGSGVAQPACQDTNASGKVTWTDLKPGTYTVKEGDNPDYWHPTGPVEQTFTLPSGAAEAVAYFGNYVNCYGLTPGYWVNWRNHYTPEEFASLLPGTIAGSIDEADAILNSLGCDGDDALHCMNRFLLANQLTLNLAQSDLAFKPGELYGVCELVSHPEVSGNLAYWLGEAQAIHDANGVGYDRDYILWVKTVLDWFANLKFPS